MVRAVITQRISVQLIHLSAVVLAFALTLVGCESEGSGDCVAGAEGCECLAGDSCAGTDLLCVAGTCEVRTTGSVELNGACVDSSDCSEFDGQSLSCNDGTCQLSSCLSGVTNCPCGPGSACDDSAATCSSDGYCRDGGCVPGTEGCTCTGEGGCDEGLTCSSDECVATSGRALTLTASGARSCEAMLEDDGDDVVDIAFDATVRGELVREGGRVAVSFISVGDQDVSSSPGQLQLRSDAVTPSVGTVRCFDAAGTEISGATLQVASDQ